MTTEISGLAVPGSSPATGATELARDAAPDLLFTDEMLRILRNRVREGHRNDGFRVVLAIEGGGNRGAIAGGMAVALYDAGLVPAFDAVYGSSAGALTAAWLLSADPHRGLDTWPDTETHGAYTRMSNLLRRRPVVDLEGLIEEFYDRRLGLDAAFVLANEVEFHPLATDVDTGRPADLHSLIVSKEMLQATMRASAALPILAGRPVVLDGHRYLDAGLSEAVPFLTPAAQGATHVLILRSRRLGQISSDGMAGRLIAAWLGRYSPAARQAFLDRHRRAVDLDRRLARAAGSAACPAAVVVRPGPDTPDVSRLESDPAVISAAMAAGRRAMLDVLGTEDPAVRNAALSLLCMPGQTVPLAEVRWCMRTRRGPSIRSVPDPYS